MSTTPFLTDTTQLFSLDPNEYDESIRVMIEFTAQHPISEPLMKIPNPPIPLRLLLTAFEHIKIANDVLETELLDIELCMFINRHS